MGGNKKNMYHWKCSLIPALSNTRTSNIGHFPSWHHILRLGSQKMDPSLDGSLADLGTTLFFSPSRSRGAVSQVNEGPPQVRPAGRLH